jgi:predicted nucleotidyltransferase component of viral defense system
MTRPAPANVPASIHRRLLNLSYARGVEFNLLLTRFAIERLLYRLSISEHRDEFVLKGALLFGLWSPELQRPTHDLDLLGLGSNSPERLRGVFEKLCALAAPADGLVFDSTSILVRDIRKIEEYLGRRVQLTATLGKARIRVQVDVGFGDVVSPAPELVEYPTLLDLPAPRLRAYARETVIAEKLHTMVTLGRSNSRLKDFFDLWILAGTFAFDGHRLSEAVRATFARRGTPLPVSPPLALSSDFARLEDKVQQWRAVVRKNRLEVGKVELADVVERLRCFLVPVLVALVEGRAWEGTWPAGGPWQERRSEEP